MSRLGLSQRRRRLRLVPVFALALVIGGCSAPGDSGAPMARKQSWEVLFNRGDWGGVAKLYSRDAELVMSGAKPIRGRNAIGAEIARMVRSGVKVRIDTERSAAAGNLAYFFGRYSVLVRRKTVERGAYLEVWRRDGGRWLIHFDVNAAGGPISPSVVRRSGPGPHRAGD